MSTENTATAEAPETEVIKEENGPEVINTEYGFLEKDKFTGANKGFEFFYPQFEVSEKGLLKLKDFLTKNSTTGKDGAVTIVALVNSTIKTRIRSLANSRLLVEGKPISDEAKAKKLVETPYLFTEEEANEYSPGDREAESISGYMKKLNDIKKAVVKAKNEKNLDLAKTLAQNWKDTKAKLDALQAAQMEADSKQMSEFEG